MGSNPYHLNPGRHFAWRRVSNHKEHKVHKGRAIFFVFFVAFVVHSTERWNFVYANTNAFTCNLQQVPNIPYRAISGAFRNGPRRLAVATSASLRGSTSCGAGGGPDRDAPYHRRVNRTVIAPVSGSDGDRLAQRTRCEGTRVDRIIVEHDMMSHSVGITPENDLSGPDRRGTRIERVRPVDLRHVDGEVA
jgi:hypothetical protein